MTGDDDRRWKWDPKTESFEFSSSKKNYSSTRGSPALPETAGGDDGDMITSSHDLYDNDNVA